MKLAILSPQFPFSGKVPLVPPILEYLAALTYRDAPGLDVQLYDANQIQLTPEEIAAETVAISVMTATAPWAYAFADGCRSIGKRVVLGGIHPTALPEEAAQHADAVVVGEAESVWRKVLSDLRSGTLRGRYHGERLSLDNLPKPIDGKLKGNYQFRAFFTMRGCPYRCTFCSVRTFFGDTIRYRPIDEVVAEIDACAGKLWFNGDDNIWGGDLQRSIDLFNALGERNRGKWYGFGDLRSIQSEQGSKMLAAARRSGLFSVWVGWENEESQLGTFKAEGKQGGNRIAAVKKMQDAGIDVTLFVVLGGRQDSIDSFKRTLELSERLQVGIHPVLLTPLPGTELYDQYRQYLIPGLGWEAFTGVRSVFVHPSPDMSPLRREQEYHRLSNELFRFERIAGRIAVISSKGFPSTHIYSFMMQVPMKHALSKAYEEWKAENGMDATVYAHSDYALKREELADTTMSRNDSFFQRLDTVAGFWFWFASIVAITFIDQYNATSYKGLYTGIQVVLFLTSFLAILGHLYLSRRRIFRKLDVVIDWKKNGQARKALLIRQFFLLALVCAGQYWAYRCVFHY